MTSKNATNIQKKTCFAVKRGKKHEIIKLLWQTWFCTKYIIIINTNQGILIRYYSFFTGKSLFLRKQQNIDA